MDVSHNNQNSSDPVYKMLESLEERIMLKIRKIEQINNMCQCPAQKNEPTAINVLRKHVIGFWDNVSLPAFSYLARFGLSDRFLWILLLFLSLLVSSRLIGESYRKWQDSPVLLSFNDSHTPVGRIPFPAVTICPGRRLRPVDVDQLVGRKCLGQGDECVERLTPRFYSAAHFLCPFSSKYNEPFRTIYNDTHARMALPKDFKEIGIGCELFSSYKFGNQPVRMEEFTFEDFNATERRLACDKDFQSLFMEKSRMCFTYNMLPAHLFFRPGVVSPVVDQTSVPFKKDWSPDSMFHHAFTVGEGVREELESVEDEGGGKSVPRYTTSNGRWAGLSFGIVKFVANETTDKDCLASDRQPMIIVHPPYELPMLRRHKKVDFRPGRDPFIQLRPNIVAAGPELVDYAPVRRRCLFSHERTLALFSYYTQRNCQLECRSNCSLQVCDCVPYYLPRINSSVEVCPHDNPSTCGHIVTLDFLEQHISWRDILYKHKFILPARIQEQFKSVESRFSPGDPLTDKMVRESTPNCNCDCPVTCNSIEYDLHFEESITPEKYKVFALLKGLEDNKISMVTLFFGEVEYISVLRKELIGFTDFVANSGGVLGVFMGFNFLALGELVYYLTLRLWSTIKHSLCGDEIKKFH